MVLAAALSSCSRASQDIWLNGQKPFTGSWAAGISMRVGAELMLEEINAHKSLLPGYTLRVVWQDNHCDAAKGQELYLQSLLLDQYSAFAPGVAINELDADRDGLVTAADVVRFEEVWNSSKVHPRPVGLLGAGCSGPTMKVAPIAFQARMPHVCGSASFAPLSDRTRYPNFFRTMPPDTLLAPAWFAMAKDLGLSSAIAVIMDVGIGFAAMASPVLGSARAAGVRLVGNDFGGEVPGFFGLRVGQDDQPSAAAAAADLIRYQQRLVVLLAYAGTIRLLVCEAYKRRFLNAVYMVYGWISFGWWDELTTECTAEQMRSVALAHIGALQTYFRADTSTRLSCSESMTAQQFWTEAWRRQNVTPGDTSMQPAGFYPRLEFATLADAVCTFAQALHSVLFDRGLALPELVERTPTSYAAMVDAIAATDFEGVTGRLRFPPGRSDPTASVLLFQLQEHGGSLESVDIAMFNQDLNYLGKGSLVFQLPGEVFEAGPAGATRLGADVSQFARCGGSEVLDFQANRCANCMGNTTFVSFSKSCLCVPGFFAAGGSGCEPCPGGTYSTTVGATSCKSCGRGTFSPPGASECTFCPRGSYADTAGLEVCHNCPSLHTTLDIASWNISSCLCGRDTYMSDGRCEPCPSGSATAGAGSSSVRSCLCATGTYMSTRAQACLACPEGMLCPWGSSEANAAFIALAAKSEEQEFPKLLPRYWASSSEPMSIFECRSEHKCPGDRYPGDACAPHLSGRACDACFEGYGWNGAACEPCSETASSLLLFPLVPALLIPLAVVVLYRFLGDAYEKWSSWRNGVGTVAFITLNHAQLMHAAVNCNVAFPRFVKDMLGVWGPSANFAAGVNLDCRGMSDVYSSILLQGLTPLACAVACAIVYWCSLLVSRLASRDWLAMDRDRLFNIFGSFVLAFFNAIVMISMVLFKCKDNPNGTRSLHVDMGVVCFTSSEWQSLLVVAVILLLVYSAGVGGLFIRAVVVAPSRFHNPGFRARWKFLFIRYRADVFWWSIVYLAQNFFTSLAFVVTFEGVTQLHLTVLVTGSYMCSLILMRPYRLRVANYLDIFARVSIINIAALLTWHAETQTSAASVTVAVDAAVACLTFLPGAAALCTAVYLFRFGRRFPATPEQLEGAEQEFTEMLDQIAGLSLLDSSEGAELILSLEEWDRWYLRKATMAISADVLGKSRSWRLVDESLSQRVLAKARPSNSKAVQEALAQRIRRSTIRDRGPVNNTRLSFRLYAEGWDGESPSPAAAPRVLRQLSKGAFADDSDAAPSPFCSEEPSMGGSTPAGSPPSARAGDDGWPAPPQGAALDPGDEGLTPGADWLAMSRRDVMI